MNTICVRETLFISAGTIMLDDNSRVETEVDDTMTVVRIFETSPDGTERLVGFNIACDTDEPGGDAYDLTRSRPPSTPTTSNTAPKNETLAQSNCLILRRRMRNDR